MTDVLLSDPVLLLFVIVGLAATGVSIVRDTLSQMRKRPAYTAIS